MALITRNGSASFRTHRRRQLLSAALGHIGKGAQCNCGVGECPASSHLGSNPNRFHNLFIRYVFTSSDPGVTINAIWALGDVLYSDELLRDLGQRSASKHRSTKCLKVSSIAGASS